MRKIFLVGILLCLACETGLELNLEGVLAKSANVVNVESELLGAKQQVAVALGWKFTKRPEADAIVVERSMNDSLNFIQIASLDVADSVYYIDTDTILKPTALVYYRLGCLTGTAKDYFKTTEIGIPGAQNFYQPDKDTLTISDTLEITFAKLSDFDKTDIAIYDNAPTSIDSLLNNLTNPKFSTTITDTTIKIPFPDSTYPNSALYTIKLMSINVPKFVTSTGFRGFFKKP